MQSCDFDVRVHSTTRPIVSANAQGMRECRIDGRTTTGEEIVVDIRAGTRPIRSVAEVDGAWVAIRIADGCAAREHCAQGESAEERGSPHCGSLGRSAGQ
jgi:hypothetical protein